MRHNLTSQNSGSPLVGARDTQIPGTTVIPLNLEWGHRDMIAWRYINTDISAAGIRLGSLHCRGDRGEITRNGEPQRRTSSTWAVA